MPTCLNAFYQICMLFGSQVDRTGATGVLMRGISGNFRHFGLATAANDVHNSQSLLPISLIKLLVQRDFCSWYYFVAGITRDHSSHGLRKWEEALLCNAFPHCPSPYPEWSLISLSAHVMGPSLFRSKLNLLLYWFIWIKIWLFTLLAEMATTLQSTQGEHSLAWYHLWLFFHKKWFFYVLLIIHQHLVTTLDQRQNADDILKLIFFKIKTAVFW